MLLRAQLGLSGPLTCGARRTCVVALSTSHRNGSRGSGRPSNRFVQKQQEVRKDAEEVAVPEVGWMWMKPGQRQQTSRQPSAMATVANLRADHISAKKYVDVPRIGFSPCELMGSMSCMDGHANGACMLIQNVPFLCVGYTFPLHVYK